MQTLIVLFNESDEKISGHVLHLAWHEKDIQKGGEAGWHLSLFKFLSFAWIWICLCTQMGNMLDMNWLQPAKELVKHNIQYIVFQKLKYFWVAKACHTKSIQYHIRFMTIFIGRVNQTMYELLIFRTDKVVAPSETETSEYPATLFTCGCALNNKVYKQ